LQEIEAKRKLKDSAEYFKAYRERMPFPWFQSKGNQITLLRNLRNLSELDYKTLSDLECEQKRGHLEWDAECLPLCLVRRGHID